MGNKSVDIVERARVLALLEHGVPVKQVSNITDVSSSTVYQIRKVAYDRGYHPVTNPTFKDEFFKDAPRSGRPEALDEEQTQKLLD